MLTFPTRTGLGEDTPVPHETCAWYQVPRGGTTAANDTTSYCEFAGARLLRPDYVYERLTGIKIGGDDLLNNTTLVFNAAVYGLIGYLLYSMTKGGS